MPNSIDARWTRSRRNPRRLALMLAGSLLLACSDERTDADATSGAGASGAGGSLAAGAGGALRPLGQAGGGAGGVGGASITGAAGAGAGAGGTSAAGGSNAIAGAGGAGGSSAAEAGAAAAGSGGSGGSSGSTAPTPSEGCGVAPAPAGEASLEVDGTTRTYLVELPASYDSNAPYPLILGFHGAGLDAERFRNYFSLGSVAGEEAIIVYLDALGNPTGWQYTPDIPFVAATLELLKSQYCIDEQRVFATGHSSGGYFTNALGCRLGAQLRAIAPVSGGVGIRSMCEGMPAVWIAHGDADEIVPTDEGRSARDFWTEKNGCDDSMSTAVDPAPCVAYAGCDDRAPVHYCEYSGEHGPPSFAVEALWSFFKSL